MLSTTAQKKRRILQARRARTALQMAPLGGQQRGRVGVADGNPLHHRGLGLCNESIFECEHAHVGAEYFEQLARSQQVIRITRPAEGRVACRERFVNQQAAR